MRRIQLSLREKRKITSKIGHPLFDKYITVTGETEREKGLEYPLSSLNPFLNDDLRYLIYSQAIITYFDTNPQLFILTLIT